MKNKTMLNRIALLTALTIVSLPMLTGCSKKSGEQEYVPIIRETYEKNVYESTKVETGTITPTLRLTLKPDEFEIVNYKTNSDFVEVASLNVEVGDLVKEGQVMVAFKNDGIEDELKELRNHNEENSLLLEHYKNLAAIDTNNSYKDEIKSVTDDIEVTNAYIKEAEAKLKDYQIICTRSGVVTEISEELYDGYGYAGKNLLEITCGSSNYSTTTKDGYDFVIGDVFEAHNGELGYDLKLVEINEKDESRELIFEPMSDMSTVGEKDKLELVISKSPIQNAKYVDERAICRVDDFYYVFVLDEQGFKHPVEVKLIDIIDDQAVIEGDVEAGEWVSVG